ncbi:DoxX family protein [Klebsiella aerogenes]|nr:DoxX family protein [Klebsiella aerogenes]HBV9945913.1 hypothetical protein [Klebsiella aerogenes]HEJ0418092.1 DoxX family protein [Klebsiella aerogenes]
MYFINNLLFSVFIVIFCIGVLANLTGPKGIVDSYKRWGLPGWFRFITAAFEALAVALVFTPFKLIGYGLALGVMGGAVVILVFNKEFRPVIAPLLTAAVIIFLMS